MKNTNNSSNNISHPLRLIAGVYLLYLAYSLIKTWADLDNKLLFGFFIGIFGIIGLLLLITSGLALLRSRNLPVAGPDVPDQTQEEPRTEHDVITEQPDETENQKEAEDQNKTENQEEAVNEETE